VAVWSSGRIQKVGSPADVFSDPAVIQQVIGI